MDEIVKEEPVFYDVEKCMEGSSESDETIESLKQPHELIPHKSFECNWCHRRFTSEQRLQKHVRVHTNNKPFQCQICLKKFNQKMSLQTHKSIHTGEKPYRCSQCIMKFRLKLYLDRHIEKYCNETIHTENVDQFTTSTEPIPEFLL